MELTFLLCSLGSNEADLGQVLSLENSVQKFTTIRPQDNTAIYIYVHVHTYKNSKLRIYISVTLNAGIYKSHVQLKLINCNSM